jgi:hypothetical protein
MNTAAGNEKKGGRPGALGKTLDIKGKEKRAWGDSNTRPAA